MWQAPRTAYLITAAAAEGDAAGAARLWAALGDGQGLDVLRALGAQARSALHGAGRAGWALDAGILAERTAPALPREALRTVLALLRNERWDAPPPDCRAAAVIVLAGVCVGCGRRTGLSAEGIAHHCRQAAAQVAAL